MAGSQNTGQKFGQPSIGSTAGMQDLMYAGQAASLPREFIKGYCQLIGCGSIYGQMYGTLNRVYRVIFGKKII